MPKHWILPLYLAMVIGIGHQLASFCDSVRIGGQLYENGRIVEGTSLYYFVPADGGKSMSFSKEDVRNGKVEIIRSDSAKQLELLSPQPDVLAAPPVEHNPIEDPTPQPSTLAQSSPGTIALSSEEFTLNIRMALVRKDLSVVPVPRRTLILSSEQNPRFGRGVLITTLEGNAASRVPAGSYRIVSESPVEFENKLYSWDVRFEATASDILIELSNDNALVAEALPSAPPATTPLPDHAAVSKPEARAIYESAASSVATLDVESGHGTAFLIDASGLLVTNEHVVSGSRSFIVNFSNSERYRSVLIASDPIADVAVIRIHPDAAAGRIPLPLASDSIDSPALREGDHVYAIGSPISQEGLVTAGIVGKVEERAIISDVMIDHGNSGGPLLNSRGEVVGINTFGQGRGISGTIRIAHARQLVDEAKTKAPMFWIPSSTRLPAYPDEKYPPEALKRLVLEQDFDLTNYLIRARKFDVLILTPPASIYHALQVDIETAQAREKKRKRKGVDGGVQYDPASVIKGWGEYAGLYAPTVKVLVQPKIKATAGSVFGAMLLGSAVLNYKYAGEFDEMQLLRGGVEQPVIKLGREMMKVQASTNVGRMEDAAYAGTAEYLPEAFLTPGGPMQPVKLVIGDELNPDKKIEVDIPSSVLERIRQDFEPMKGTN